MIIDASIIVVGAIEVDIGNSKCNARTAEAGAVVALVVAPGLALVVTAAVQVAVAVSRAVVLAAATMTVANIRSLVNVISIATRETVLKETNAIACLAQLCKGNQKRTRFLLHHCLWLLQILLPMPLIVAELVEANGMMDLEKTKKIWSLQDASKNRPK